MTILNIQKRYYDNCNFIYLSYSTVYNIIVFGVIYYMLYHMNGKDATIWISSNGRLADCVIKF